MKKHRRIREVKFRLITRDSDQAQLMTQRLSVTKAVLSFSLSLAIASCGPSLEEQQQTREAERLQRIAASEQALATFAESHGATPVEIWSDPFGDPLGLRRSFTAQLQDELEGSVVAFRGSSTSSHTSARDSGSRTVRRSHGGTGRRTATSSATSRCRRPAPSFCSRSSPSATSKHRRS